MEEEINVRFGYGRIVPFIIPHSVTWNDQSGNCLNHPDPQACQSFANEFKTFKSCANVIYPKSNNMTPIRRCPSSLISSITCMFKASISCSGVINSFSMAMFPYLFSYGSDLTDMLFNSLYPVPIILDVAREQYTAFCRDKSKKSICTNYLWRSR